MLRTTSEKYGVKLEAFKLRHIIRITSGRDSCGDVFRLYKHMIESIGMDRCDVKSRPNTPEEIRAYTQTIAETERLTRTVIKGLNPSKKGKRQSHGVSSLWRSNRKYTSNYISSIISIILVRRDKM